MTDSEFNKENSPARGLSRSQKTGIALLAVIIAALLPLVLRVLTFAPLDELPALLDYVMEEMLPGKEKIVAVDGMIDYYIFGDAGGRDVVKGEDGWYFYRNTMQEYHHTNRYSSEELRQIAENLSEIDAWLEEQGIPFVLFIAPNKVSVYDRYLPAYYHQGEGLSRVQEMVQYLRENTQIKVIFPEEYLRETAASSAYPVYYRTDTHWNYLGGYHGAKALIDEIGELSLPELSEEQIGEVHGPLFRWNDYDLINMMGLQYTYEDEVSYEAVNFSDVTVEYEGETAAGYNGFYGSVRAFSDASDDRKLFMIRDSFGTSMMPYVASCFREVYSPYIWSDNIGSQITHEKPDIVVLELVERDEFLNYVLEGWN